MLKIDATLETRISKKTNEEYKVLVVNLPYGLKKNVFLEEAELKLIELADKNGGSPDFVFPEIKK